MDTYTLALNALLNLPSISLWPELHMILKRAANNRDHNWQLPLIACDAVGGNMADAIPAMAAIACLQLSIILIDDMLDADPRGEHHRVGTPTAANLAVALQAMALEVLEQKDICIHPASLSAAIRSINYTALITALGQNLDAQNPTDEITYWKVVEVKSAPFFGAAFYIGALLGGASLEMAEQLKCFGHLYGEMIQVYDDLHDTMAVPANPDWLLGRSPLPILFAQVVNHPDQVRFLELRRSILNPESLTEAQAILVRCGAVSYGIYHLLHRYHQARTLLSTMSLPEPNGLDALLKEQIQPVQELFKLVDSFCGEAIQEWSLLAMEESFQAGEL